MNIQMQAALPEDQVKILQSYLHGKRCRICNHDDFVISKSPAVVQLLGAPDPSGQLPAAIFVIVTCAMCGHAEFFNGRQYGLGVIGQTPGA